MAAPNNRWDLGRVEAVDPYVAKRALDRLRSGLGIHGTAPTGHPERYAVAELLGGATFGRVYRARDREQGGEVAIKAVRMDRPRASFVKARLEQQARALSHLRDVGVGQVMDVAERCPARLPGDETPDDDAEVELQIVMELVRGMTLREWVRKCMPTRQQILDAFSAAGEALVAAHGAGVLHLDFKPSNVMRRDDGRIVVLDFGLALVPRRAGVRGPEAVACAGTPAYMPPEQHVGRRLDERADVYAFAASLYEALLFRRPFAGQTTLELWRAKLAGAPSLQSSGLDTRLAAVLERALSPDPRDRHPSMRALLDALAESRRTSRSRNLVAAAVAAVAAVFVLAVPEPAAPSPDATPPVPTGRDASPSPAETRESASPPRDRSTLYEFPATIRSDAARCCRPSI